MQWWNDLWASVGTFLASIGLLDLALNLGYVLLVVLGALVVRWLLRILIRHSVNNIVTGVKRKQQVTDTQALQASPIAAIRIVQRTRTLGSVLNNIVNVVLVTVVLLLIIEQLAPGMLGSLALLTAAVGAGLGFGAQNIVKDALNGLFMVTEDQLGVGDVVDLGPAVGVVEAVTIRITHVRDVNGVLWYVRNGEITRVGNMSQGWARVIIDLAIPYEADVEQIEAALLETAVTMAESATWRSRVLEKPEMWGLESISAEALVLRLVVKTRTSAKDDVARELRMRLKRTLDELDVRLPSLNTVVLNGFEAASRIKGARPPKPATGATKAVKPTTGATKTSKPATGATKTSKPATGATKPR